MTASGAAGVDSILGGAALLIRTPRAIWAEDELESQARGTAQHRPGEPADHLGPAKRFLGSLALLLADRVAVVARRAGIDRRAAFGGVLGDVRRRG
jgi:hypothetical protein